MRFLTTMLYYILAVPAGLVLVALAVANRGFITLSLDPFNPANQALSLQVPLFVLLFAMLFAGMLLGGLAVWISQGKWRKKARSEARAVRRMQREGLAAKDTPQQNTAIEALPAPPHAF
jgi:hypothetical protein